MGNCFEGVAALIILDREEATDRPNISPSATPVTVPLSTQQPPAKSKTVLTKVYSTTTASKPPTDTIAHTASPTVTSTTSTYISISPSVTPPTVLQYSAEDMVFATTPPVLACIVLILVVVVQCSLMVKMSRRRRRSEIDTELGLPPEIKLTNFANNHAT